jgi:hypothetical protein
MTLRSFLSQHFGYGCAAFNYYRRSGDRTTSSAPPPSFLFVVMRNAAFESRGLDRLWAPLLVVLSQVATIVGMINRLAMQCLSANR